MTARFRYHDLIGNTGSRADRDDIELSAGDCLYSPLDAPHRFANRGRSTCKYLAVIAR